MTIFQNLDGRSTPVERNSAIRHFTPNWYASTMGTGILAICLGQFPAVPLLFEAGETLWILNIALFLTLTLLYGAKWMLHPRDALLAFDHPVVSMFFGCIPMSLAMIINGLVVFGIPVSGNIAVSIAEALWWFDAGLAVLAGLAIPFAMFTRQEHAIHHMSAVWLLPVVACEVAAASGALLLPHLASPSAQFGMLFTSYVLWSCSVPLALGILVILFLRMVLHKLPPASMAATSFLALGPIGTGALGLALFAANGGSVLEARGLGAFAPAMSGASLLGAILLWGYGLWWLGIAIATTLRNARTGIPFNLGWWAFTFPIGVYAIAGLRLGDMLHFPPLTAFAILLVAALSVIWIIVAWKTIAGARRGLLFSDPCIES